MDPGKNRPYKNERFLFEIMGNSSEFLAQKYKKKSTRGASSVRTLACKLCKETKGETFWPPEMTRRARGLLNKKKRINGGKKKEEGRRQKEKKIQELFRQWAEMQLSYNFTWTIKPSDHPKFFLYHIRIILCPVPSFCSLWTADVFRLSHLSLRKFRKGEKRLPETRLQFKG